ncbi:MAG: RdgB/HAM1 family non-canonical purine NTP pyrophosphatase, partial [Muribaculaceae bacterium]|nr:RdgB/HAM1 family non-canonical purine NTP pyrophosphatase [Muribaculaceae bacterium]
MTNKLKLVMATNNAGKLREARAIAGDRLEILSLDDIGYHRDIEETADSLEGNALIKVRAIKDATGLDCFADDTGLMVDALGGAPGVHTARYAGEDCNPDANIDLMLRNLEGVSDRSARFRTCVALSLDGEEHTFEGSVEGRIATHRSGSQGFGYDPIFIPDETGVCFAEMTDEAKNAISHRGRAITAMIKWISTLCLCLIFTFGARAAASDWRLFNTFDEKVEHVFDSPLKTYYLVLAQLYDQYNSDNDEKLMFLFALDKETDEIRPYNIQNHLSQSLIKKANYNARKNYLLLVYNDYTIDLLYDDGTVRSIPALKNYNYDGTKGVRSISFDPDSDRAYLATDFGYIAIDDSKYEVASSGIYRQPIDKMVRVADYLAIVHDRKLFVDNADSPHLALSDFKEADWGGAGEVGELIPLTSERCLLSRAVNGSNTYYIIDFKEGAETPKAISLGKLDNSFISENKNGLLIARYGHVFQLERDADAPTYVERPTNEFGLVCGSWDFKNFYSGRPREGFYSMRYESDGSWTMIRDMARPNAPAVFRSNNLMYSSRHGMMVNTHGIDQNFTSRNAKNPILLSGVRDQEWTMYGLPYHDPETALRLINPCGMAQDPDNPDIFYFGSLHNGLLRYNITD